MTVRNVDEIGRLDLAERVGVLKADLENSNEIGQKSAKFNRLRDFGFTILFLGLRPLRPSASFSVSMSLEMSLIVDNREEPFGGQRFERHECADRGEPFVQS
jgi:hypothetical protein